jgi:outer membrane protein assembly factor BamE (lipoprotein component of BamABCDE complex)
MFRRVAYVALAAGLLTAAAACAPITTYSGFQAIEANPKDVKVGTDTKSTVRASLGSPSATLDLRSERLVLHRPVKQRVAFRRPVITSRNVVAVTFDKETEVVKEIDTLTLKDGKVIAFNGRETPTRGRELTILEQLLGNVGRGGMLPRADDEGVPGSRPGDRR